MERFFSLPPEKQNVIVNAALSVFGANGYKKASVRDIAAAAGISKAMVFHYFGTKKDLYRYLVHLCGRTVMDEIDSKFDKSTTDFFKRVLSAAEIKIALMKRRPAILTFLNSVYFEKDDEVKAIVQAVLHSSESEGFRDKIAFDGVDLSKFKEGTNPALVMKLLLYFTYGYLDMQHGTAQTDFDALYGDFRACVLMLKNNFYRKEAL